MLKRSTNSYQGGVLPPVMPHACLDQLALAWENWAAMPQAPARKIARARLHLIFLLIRFGGLRLAEALAFEPIDLDLQTGLLQTRGSFARHLLLPLQGRRSLRRILSLEEASKQGFLHLDPGFIRRTFHKIASFPGFSPAWAGPRALRYLRGHELLTQHMPLKLVQDYLGLARPTQIGAFLEFISSTCAGLAESREPNTFTGVIEELAAGVRSMQIRLRTFSGFKLVAHCAMQEFARMEFRPQMVVRARIAPDQIVLGNQYANYTNVLAGKLTALYNDGVESFIALELKDGEIVQAEMESCLLAGFEHEHGQEVLACFPARAVALHVV